jgi:hypothetical protein
VKLALLCAFLSVAIPVVAQGVDCSTPHFEKKITIKGPAVFTGTLEDNTNTSIAMKGIVLTGVDKKAPPLSQVAVTDSNGVFHFDSVPAGKYVITIDFTGVSVKKDEVQCPTSGSCRVTLVVRSVSPHDCYRGHYADDGVSEMRH